MVEFATTLLRRWLTLTIHIAILLALLAARSSSCFQAICQPPAQVTQIQSQLLCLVIRRLCPIHTMV